MTRPCRWPDGGCAAEIIDVITVNGRKQVLDATPTKGIILVIANTDNLIAPPHIEPTRARVVDIYVDHHATCPKWAAKVERERAAKAAGS